MLSSNENGIEGTQLQDMPQDGAKTVASQKPTKRVSIGRIRGHTESESSSTAPVYYYRSDGDSDSALTPAIRGRLHELFGQIEKEFENLYTENVSLQDKIEILNERLEREAYLNTLDNRAADFLDGDVFGPNKNPSKQKSLQTGNLIKTTHKLKAQTSKIVSSFKAAVYASQLIKEYRGHRDGVWEVSVSKNGQPLIGTASADHTARIWNVDSSACLLQYVGHRGSVNSIRFHPNQDLVVSASGDGSAHVWRCITNQPIVTEPKHSTDEEIPDKEEKPVDEVEQLLSHEGFVLRSPLVELSGHTGVVIAADWLTGGDQIITASWDRTANLHDAQTGELLHCLVGHDLELTYVSAHPSQRLVVTCSKDTTFRLWDFRESIHSVSVFQGHTDAVNSAAFTSGDKVVSGSDDRSVKVWDLKNMRSPLTTIRADSPINRLSVSAQQIIAIPHDNRNVRLYDLHGVRVGRLIRNNRQGHRRMVCSASWLDDSHSHVNLFTSGFDRQVLGWTVLPSTKDGKD